MPQSATYSGIPQFGLSSHDNERHHHTGGAMNTTRLALASVIMLCALGCSTSTEPKGTLILSITAAPVIGHTVLQNGASAYACDFQLVLTTVAALQVTPRTRSMGRSICISIQTARTTRPPLPATPNCSVKVGWASASGSRERLDIVGPVRSRARSSLTTMSITAT